MSCPDLAKYHADEDHFAMLDELGDADRHGLPWGSSQGDTADQPPHRPLAAGTRRSVVMSAAEFQAVTVADIPASATVTTPATGPSLAVAIGDPTPRPAVLPWAAGPAPLRIRAGLHQRGFAECHPYEMAAAKVNGRLVCSDCLHPVLPA